MPAFFVARRFAALLLPRSRRQIVAESGGTKMKIRNSADNYGAIARAVHWASALAVFGAWGGGQLVDAFGKSAEATIVFAHIQAGLAVLALLAVRLAWRYLDPAPAAIPSALDPWAARAATVGHLALYALLLGAPIAGIATLFARGETLHLFGLWDIVSPWVRDRAFARSTKEVHELFANGLIILAALHAAAALIHHYVLRDRTLRRMLAGA
jgi:cytochrome b561